MESWFYFTVRAIAAGYILHKTWRLLFSGRSAFAWGLVFRHALRGGARQASAKTGAGKKDGCTPAHAAKDDASDGEEEESVVGRSHAVYLDDPELAAKLPVRSEKLEPSGFMGEEPDILDDDVESGLLPVPKTPGGILEEMERFEIMDDLAPDADPDFSTGLSYDEMANAIGVLTVPTDDEKKIIEAAKTIYSIRNTDLFEFFTKEVSNLDNVEKLMGDCLDNDGTPLAAIRSKKSHRGTDPFDIDKYV